VKYRRTDFFTDKILQTVFYFFIIINSKYNSHEKFAFCSFPFETEAGRINFAANVAEIFLLIVLTC
jgi:hypothetical protein